MNSTPIPDLTRYHLALTRLNTVQLSGRIIQVVGLTIEATGLDCQIGEVCEIRATDAVPLVAEVVGFREQRTLLMPLGDMQGIQPGCPIVPLKTAFRTPVGEALLGRVLDGLAKPIDGKGSLGELHTVPTYNAAPHPLNRKAISEPMVTGIRVMDALLTTGRGQRLGIFAGSGVGKSVLMGSIARSSKADVSVIALVGERGREVQEFIDHDLGEEGLKRSVVVVSTSDQPALIRLKAAWVATTIAEFFRDNGLNVTLLMDSVTRFAMAQREVGLAIGEPPASKGYPPSVFALLPKLLERAGNNDKGSITGFYTVLVEGDDFTEPICDAARSILDGHIVLTRDLAARNHYPAIDVLNSVSRVMPAVTSSAHRASASKVRMLLATYEKARDLINIGAYVKGSDLEIDAAINAMPSIMALIQQGQNEFTPFEDCLRMMQSI